MGYDPQNAKEEPMLPADTIFDGVVLNIEDGKVKDFVKNLEKWSEPDGLAIELKIGVVHNDKEHRVKQVFQYRQEDGKTVYSANSKFGKYAKKYGHLPTVKDVVKVITNTDGFLRLKLD